MSYFVPVSPRLLEVMLARTSVNTSLVLNLNGAVTVRGIIGFIREAS